MKKNYLLIIVLISTLQLYSQTWKWVHSNYESGSGGAVAFDGAGNLFLSGLQQISSGSGSHTFIEKFGSMEDSLWVKYSFMDAAPHNMALGPDTSIFLVGNGYIGASSFVTKYDKEGNLIWNYWNSAGGQYPHNRAHSIAVDSYGNSYASGIYEDTAKFGNCTFINPNQGTFVVKLSPQGNCLWTMDIPNGGNYYSNVTIDGNDDLIISTPDSIIKVSNNQIQWVIPITRRAWSPVVSEVKTDTLNNIYFVVGGDSVQVGSIAYNISPYHGLLVKLTPAGSITWMKEISGPGESIFIGKAIYLTSYYDTRIQKISLDGDSLWCRKLTSDHLYFSISNITGSKNGLIAITGQLDGVLKDGNDTILKSNGMSPFVAVLEDIDSTTNIIVNKQSELSFNVFPNPAADVFTIQVSKNISSLEIINLFGERVYSSNLSGSQCKVDFSVKSKGIYFLEIVCNGERVVKKIVLE